MIYTRQLIDALLEVLGDGSEWFYEGELRGWLRDNFGVDRKRASRITRLAAARGLVERAEAADGRRLLRKL